MATSFHFFSVSPAAWNQHGVGSEGHAERREPTRQSPQEDSLSRIEFRGLSLLEQCQQLTAAGDTPVLFAQSPKDLAALLRTADQLLAFAREGDSTTLWQCACGARLAGSPMFIRPTSVRCSHCGRSVDVDVNRQHAVRTDQRSVERVALAEFFRESMARSWPVLLANRALSLRSGAP
jgi:hypothetical protein